MLPFGDLDETYTTYILVKRCNSLKGKVIDQKVKGHGSKMRSKSGIFGFKKLGSHRLELGALILDI